jgi:hypothetical protein
MLAKGWSCAAVGDEPDASHGCRWAFTPTRAFFDMNGAVEKLPALAAMKTTRVQATGMGRAKSAENPRAGATRAFGRSPSRRR